MDNRLSEFASHQMIAIDSVLGMVARDRRRVETLIQEAESPSLRRYLSQWLDATVIAATETASTEEGDGEDENTTTTSVDGGCGNTTIFDRNIYEKLAVQASPNNTTIADNYSQQQLQHLMDGDCCPSKCWKDDTRSFWDIFRTSPPCVQERFAALIKRHARKRSRLAFGVEYAWPINNEVPSFIDMWESLSDLPTNGRVEWEDLDHFYKSHDARQFEAWNNMEQGALWTQESLFCHKMIVPEAQFNALLNSSFIHEHTPSVDQVMEAGGAIIYDIIFQNVRIDLSDWSVSNDRTSKGTLVLSTALVTIDIDDDDGGDNEESTVQQHPVIKGTVKMDPQMHCALDPAPSRASVEFEFVETKRVERITSTRKNGQEPFHQSSSCSVMYVTVTKSSSCDVEATGGNQDESNDSSGDNNCDTCSLATGELKVFCQRDASFLSSGSHAKPQIPTTRQRRMELAKEVMANFEKKRCLWMHGHTNLPESIIRRIGQYACPPPVFYFEEDDLVLDLDWTESVLRMGSLSGEEGTGNVMSASCIIARRRNW